MGKRKIVLLNFADFKEYFASGKTMRIRGVPMMEKWCSWLDSELGLNVLGRALFG